MPDHSKLSRRHGSLMIACQSRAGPSCALAVDSIDVKVYWKGEWKIRQQTSHLAQAAFLRR